MPVIINTHCPFGDTPEATTPQANAHMGGNHVMGLRSSVKAEKVGRAMQTIVPVTLESVN
jgi:hypothetical protein